MPPSNSQRRALTDGPIASTLFFFTLPMLAGNGLQSATILEWRNAHMLAKEPAPVP